MIDIRVATLASASWVLAYLRPEDRAEIFCQLPDAYPTGALAEMLILQGEAYAAFEKGEPIALFGTTPMTVACFSVWAMGTRRFRRAVPEMSQFFLDTLVPARIGRGFTNAEARVMSSNTKAVKWMTNLGGVPLTVPFEYGKGGELFTLFRWTVAGYRDMYRAKERR